MFVVDVEGNYVEVGGAACATTGYSEEELLSMNLLDLTTEASRQSASEAFQTLAADGSASVEAEFSRKDGTTRWWVVNAVTLPDGRHLGFTTDITERKRAEEERRHLEAQSSNRPRSWRAWASSPAASPTISTTSSSGSCYLR